MEEGQGMRATGHLSMGAPSTSSHPDSPSRGAGNPGLSASPCPLPLELASLTPPRPPRAAGTPLCQPPAVRRARCSPGKGGSVGRPPPEVGGGTGPLWEAEGPRARRQGPQQPPCADLETKARRPGAGGPGGQDGAAGRPSRAEARGSGVRPGARLAPWGPAQGPGPGGPRSACCRTSLGCLFLGAVNPAFHAGRLGCRRE